MYSRILKVTLVILIWVLLTGTGFAKDNFYSPEQCSPYGPCEMLRPLFKWPQFRNIDDAVPLVSPTYCMQVALDKKFKRIVFEKTNFTTYKNELKYPPYSESDIKYQYSLYIKEPGWDTTISYSEPRSIYVLQPGTTYFWRVGPATANYPEGKRYKWSPAVEFVVVFPEPEILSPMPGSSINTISPVFRWKVVEDCIGYEIQVADNPDFNVAQGNVYKYKLLNTRPYEWLGRRYHSHGLDQIPGTEDDFDYYAFNFLNVNLQSGKTYYYRFILHFNLTPITSTITQSFSAAQSFSIQSSPLGAEILVNAQPVTDTANYIERSPNVSMTRDKLAFSRLKEYQQTSAPLSSSIAAIGSYILNVVTQNYIFFRTNVESEIWYKDIEITPGGIIISESLRPISTVLAGSRDIQPCWNPGGDATVFATTKITKDNYVIVGKSIDNELLDIFEQNDNNMTHPQYSHDGKWITFSQADESGEWYLWIISTESPIRKQVCKGKNPSWAPDDSKIAFDVGGPFGNHDVFIIDANGSGKRQLTQTEEDVNNIMPSFSPNGEWIIFTSDQTGNYDLFVIDANGIKMKQVTNFLGDDFDPCWLDNSWIAFASTRNDNWDIWVGQVPLD